MFFILFSIKFSGKGTQATCSAHVFFCDYRKY